MEAQGLKILVGLQFKERRGGLKLLVYILLSV